jgi:hypothetical protein
MISTAKKPMWCTGHDGEIRPGESYTITKDGEFLCLDCVASRKEKLGNDRGALENTVVEG